MAPGAPSLLRRHEPADLGGRPAKGRRVLMRSALTSLHPPTCRRAIRRRERSSPRPSGGQLPPGYDAVAEALVAGTELRWPPVRSWDATLARDGVSLGEALSGLGATYAALGGAVPDFAATEALSVAWSEATLEFLHDVTCEDPLTGLASVAAPAHPARRGLPGAERSGVPSHPARTHSRGRRGARRAATEARGRRRSARALRARRGRRRAPRPCSPATRPSPGSAPTGSPRWSGAPTTLGESVATAPRQPRAARAARGRLASGSRGSPASPELGVRLLAELAR